jgi:murein DD-endopeptidase MepM/ murein hydrolase activator NlpD
MLVKLLGLLIFVLLLLPTVNSAGLNETCHKDVCVITEKVANGQHVRFFVKNNHDYETTVTIELYPFENMKADEPLPRSVTIAAHQLKEVLNIKVIARHKKWRWGYQFYWTSGSKDALHSDYVYRLPYATGSTHRVVQGFNGRLSHFDTNQYAIDWEMPEGTSIHAARAGRVVDIREDSEANGLGTVSNYILIEQADKTLGGYYHLQKDGVKVQVGDEVQAGDLIGYSGNTGNSFSPHLHFFVYKAVNGYQQVSVPIRFNTAEADKIFLVEGRSYTAK